LVNVRKNVGGGSFLAGYKRAFADSSSLELHGAVGMRTLLSAQHSVQLSPESSASLIASWQPNAGPGLQVRRHDHYCLRRQHHASCMTAGCAIHSYCPFGAWPALLPSLPCLRALPARSL
jgi:hypothetical protein